MSHWFEDEPTDKSTTEGALPGHSVAENTEAATAALDKIQGAYEATADEILREFSRHADEIQGKHSPPEWPA